MEPQDKKPNFDLVVYKLDTLNDTVKEGFKSVDTKFTSIDNRLLVLELWKAQTEPFIKGLIDRAQRDVEAANTPNDKLIKIIASTLAVVTTALGILAYVLGVHL